MDAVALALPVLIALITVALAFDFLNGLHDAANSIATIVSTRVLRPQHAVIWAAFFNFVAFLIFGAHVAETVGTGIVAADIVDPRVVFAALTGAMAWNIITWGARHSLEQLACAHRGARRRRCRQGRDQRHRLGRPRQDHRRHRAVAVDRLLAGAADLPDRLMAVRALHALRGRSPVPFAATGLRFALFHRSRRERRPENHGHHHGAALFAGLSGR